MIHSVNGSRHSYEVIYDKHTTAFGGFKLPTRVRLKTHAASPKGFDNYGARGWMNCTLHVVMRRLP